MALGYFLKHIGVINDAFINVGTKITFTVAIPCMVFPSILNAHLEDTLSQANHLCSAGNHCSVADPKIGSTPLHP